MTSLLMYSKTPSIQDTPVLMTLTFLPRVSEIDLEGFYYSIQKRKSISTIIIIIITIGTNEIMRLLIARDVFTS